MDIDNTNLQEQCISRSALELIDSLDATDCWDACVSQLDALGINSVLYGYVTSRLDIERVGMTDACFYKTNHNPEWINQLEDNKLLDFDLTAELIADEFKEVPWFHESLWEQATAEQLEQSEIERELGMQVGISVQLEGFSDSPVMAGVGLCMRPVSVKEFDSYWQHHRAEVLDLCDVVK